MSNEQRKSTLFLICGHSGSGKTSVMRRVFNDEQQIVSHTTRKPRVNEIDGKDYHFITEEEFVKMLEEDKFIENVKYSGNFYGFTKEEVDKKLENGDAYAIVDFHGFKQMKKYYDNCVSIGMFTTKETAKQRMLDRGDSTESVEKRLATYYEEVSQLPEFDYILFNEQGYFERTVNLAKLFTNR